MDTTNACLATTSANNSAPDTRAVHVGCTHLAELLARIVRETRDGGAVGGYVCLGDPNKRASCLGKQTAHLWAARRAAGGATLAQCPRRAVLGHDPTSNRNLRRARSRLSSSAVREQNNPKASNGAAAVSPPDPPRLRGTMLNGLDTVHRKCLSANGQPHQSALSSGSKTRRLAPRRFDGPGCGTCGGTGRPARR